jgi:hypothetical protein
MCSLSDFYYFFVLFQQIDLTLLRLKTTYDSPYHDTHPTIQVRSNLQLLVYQWKRFLALCVFVDSTLTPFSRHIIVVSFYSLSNPPPTSLVILVRNTASPTWTGFVYPTTHGAVIKQTITNKQTNKNIQTFSSAFLAHDGVILAHRTLDDDQVHVVRATRIVCGPFKFLFSGCCSWFTWLIYYCILLPFSPLFVAPKRSRDRLPLRAEDFSCNFKITRLRCSGDPNNVFPQVF